MATYQKREIACRALMRRKDASQLSQAPDRNRGAETRTTRVDGNVLRARFHAMREAESTSPRKALKSLLCELLLHKQRTVQKPVWMFRGCRNLMADRVLAEILVTVSLASMCADKLTDAIRLPGALGFPSHG